MQPPAGICIRDVRPDEHAAVVDMMAALSSFESRLEADRTADLAANEAYVGGAWAAAVASGGFVLVAEIDSTLVGFAIVRIEMDDAYILDRFRRFAYITDLFVQDDLRGLNIGRLIFSACEQRLRAAGINRLGIGALASNAAAIKAYQRWGLRPYAVEFVKDLVPEGLRQGPETIET